MKKIILVFIFLLSACGDDSSGTNSTDNFTYGTYQTSCQLESNEETTSLAHRYLILSETYNLLEKKFIKTSNFFMGFDSCLVQCYKESSYFSFDKIEYDSNKDLYTVELNFIKDTITPSSEFIATGFNNMNLAGINTWEKDVEIDVTGKNPDGSSSTPISKKYKIINLKENDTQLIQNENEKEYPTSLDYNYIFYKIQ